MEKKGFLIGNCLQNGGKTIYGEFTRVRLSGRDNPKPFHLSKRLSVSVCKSKVITGSDDKCFVNDVWSETHCTRCVSLRKLGFFFGTYH